MQLSQINEEEKEPSLLNSRKSSYVAKRDTFYNPNHKNELIQDIQLNFKETEILSNDDYHHQNSSDIERKHIKNISQLDDTQNLVNVSSVPPSI